MSSALVLLTPAEEVRTRRRPPTTGQLPVWCRKETVKQICVAPPPAPLVGGPESDRNQWRAALRGPGPMTLQLGGGLRHVARWRSLGLPWQCLLGYPRRSFGVYRRSAEGGQLLRRGSGSPVAVGRSCSAGFTPDLREPGGPQGWGRRRWGHSFTELPATRRWVSHPGGRRAPTWWRWPSLAARQRGARVRAPPDQRRSPAASRRRAHGGAPGAL